MMISTLCVAQPDTLWTARIGGQHDKHLTSIDQMADGGFIAAGETGMESLHSAYRRSWIVRLDSMGDTLWTRAVGDSVEISPFSDVCATSDGGCLLVTESDPESDSDTLDTILLRLDAEGDTLWCQNYSFEYSNALFDAIELPDEGFILGGYTTTRVGFAGDVWLMRTDNSGQAAWSRIFGGAGGEAAYTIFQSSDTEFVAVGRIGGEWPDMDYDMLVMGFNLNGDSLWSHVFGTTESDEWAWAGAATTDGGYVIAGNQSWTGGWLLKLDHNWEEEWSWRPAVLGQSELKRVFQEEDGSYVLIGTTLSDSTQSLDFWMQKLSASGDEVWNFTVGVTSDDLLYDATRTSEGDYVLAGYSDPPDMPMSDYALIVRVATESQVIGSGTMTIPTSFSVSPNFPNPFNASTTFFVTIPTAGIYSVSIIDILGRTLETSEHFGAVAGTYRVRFDKNDFPSGTYIYRIQFANEIQMQKMILIK